VHYQNSTATIMGSYKEAAVRSRRQGRYTIHPGPCSRWHSKERARSPFRRGGCTDAIMRPRTTTPRKRSAAASLQSPAGERKEDRAATSPRLCQKVVITVSRGARGALAWRPSRPFSSFPRPVSLLRLGPRIGAPPGRTTGISAFTHARPAGSSEKKTISCCYALC